ncbi:chemotaxis protein CheB [Loktanella sp. SALINAS62]|uniref:chemotaxis protein CheB n=1 Tax=Loktanella sp. SALINAS62 TaxID=2706124 RepID=UPI001B8BEC51|nr:chemotaxis protein CheB [Loktanella sp. SALINAS62]MBS1303445.1 chemotaxis protein CheB [Loktanella sp. SALINAS62]
MQKQRAIAIGGSTGSLSVLKEIMPSLPENLPAPIFVVVHVGAHGRNLIADILDDAGPLHVSTALEGEEVESGCVYVAPADRHLLVIDGVIRLGRGPRENLARPAVDALFRSVAASYGSGAVGLVLTGNLNDGAAGLVTIKQRGGVSVVQNPADSVAPDMPLGALESTEVDYCTPPNDLADLITMLVNQPLGPEHAIDRALELEIDIALGGPCLTETVEQIADVVPLSCPACNGTLSQLKEPPLRYRCQVGHAYSAKALADQHEGSLDEAVRVALRIVEERAVLAERMARDAKEASRMRTHQDFLTKAAELRQSAEVLRAAALRLMR